MAAVSDRELEGIALEASPPVDPLTELIQARLPWLRHGDPFSAQEFGAGPWPAQGWKLHVSATPSSAVGVLDAALPVLLAEGVRFKVVNSLKRLQVLNLGGEAPTQIGKFITVYPSDDAQAVRLAVALDEATRGLRGPRIPTDRPLRPGSLVQYRHGSFRPGIPRDRGLPEAYDLLDGDGRLALDERVPFYQPPHGVADPFEAAGVYVAAELRPGLLAGRYLPANAVSRSGRGSAYRAIDLDADPPRLCLLKEFYRDTGFDDYGRGVEEWADHETAILRRFAGSVLLPHLFDDFELDGNRYLAMEYIEGKSLELELELNEMAGEAMPIDEVVRFGLWSARVLADLHALGLLYLDFKPDNVIQTPGGEYRLVDFGSAHIASDEGPPIGVGTPPYWAPEQPAGQPPAPQVDIYSWGAALHRLICGRDSVGEPSSWRVPSLRRPVLALRPDFPPALAAVLDRAVQMDPADRYPDMQEARAAFEAAIAASSISGVPPSVAGSRRSAARRSKDEHTPSPNHGDPVAPASPAHAMVPDTDPRRQTDPLSEACAIADALCAEAREERDGVCWLAHSETFGAVAFDPDIYEGTAGIALFLASLAAHTGNRTYADAARGAASWLSSGLWGHGRALPGLHCGESGLGLFYLRLASSLQEAGYVTAAELRARRLASVAAPTIEVVHGASGLLMFLCALVEAVEEPAYVGRAEELGDGLLALARPAPGGRPGCIWNVPGLSPGTAPSPTLGLSHGAAGIGFALAALARVTGEERFLAVARDAADLLLNVAVRRENGSLRWHRQLGTADDRQQAYCHGALGIGRFLLSLHRITPDPRYLEAARGCALTAVEESRRRRSVGLCHGVAGDVDFLLDCYQALGDLRWLAEARRAASLLSLFRDPARPGVYHEQQGGRALPGLGVGSAGAGAALLRLAHPDSHVSLWP